MNRVVAVVAAVFVASGAAMVTAGTAWSAPGHAVQPRVRAADAGQPRIRSAHAVLRFDVAAGVVQLTIPTPPCPVTDEQCEWMLLMNEPEVPGQPTVGTATATSGVLTLSFPDFCGVIQADALIGPAPWTLTHGVRHRIDNCGTTTTKPAPTTTTTTTKPAAVTTTTTKPPQVSAASTTPTTSALPFTAATSASPTTTSGPGATAAAAQLPFTGLDIRPLILLGSALILFGGLLLTTVESRRRALQRASAVRLDDVREGTRRASSWFLGL
jgi:hypothetical protein